MSGGLLPETAREVSHRLIERVVRPGDRVVDATAGNGYDTLFLAELVGGEGRVFSFDIQQLALSRTLEKLTEKGWQNRAELILKSHAEMKESVEPGIAACMFNLGFLPAGDKRIKTLWDSTREAISAALTLLRPGGMLTVCAYPGHAEGREEAEALAGWLNALPEREYTACHLVFANQKASSPQLFAVEKKLSEI